MQFKKIDNRCKKKKPSFFLTIKFKGRRTYQLSTCNFKHFLKVNFFFLFVHDFFKINEDKEWTSSVNSFVISYKMKTNVIMRKKEK